MFQSMGILGFFFFFLFISRMWSSPEFELSELSGSLFWVWGHWGVWQSVSRVSHPWTLWRTVYCFCVFFEVYGFLSPRKRHHQGWLESASRTLGVSCLGHWVPGMKSLMCLRACVPTLIFLSLRAGGIGALHSLYVSGCKAHKQLRAVYEYPCSWVYIPGCKVSELFDRVCPKLWGL